MKRTALALFLLSPFLHAEEVPLTLAEAVEKARAHSARLAQLAALEDAAAAAVRGARAQRWPQLDLIASYARNSNVPELAIISPGPPPSRQVVFPNIPDNYRTRAGLTLPLDVGGRIAGGIDASRARRDAARGDLAGATADLALETEGAFWSLVNARDSARVFRESIASYDTHLEDAQNRFDLGLAPRSELLAVQVERDRAELARLQSENQARVANANLVRLVGLPPSARVVPAPAAASPPPAPAPAELEALVAAALPARPETAALRARLSAAEAAIRVVRADSLPQAGITAGYDYARPNTRILPLVDEWNGTWSVGVSISLTAFDGGRTSAAVAQARAQSAAVRSQIEDLEQRIRLEVTTRFLDVSTAEAALHVAERNLLAAQESVKVETDRYHEGVGASADLLDAETRLLHAGLDRTVATTDVSLARAGLDRAVAR